MSWQKVTLVGVGLLGGSLGMALRQSRLAQHVEGFVRRSESIAPCLKLGAVDTATTDLLAAVTQAELIVLCTPVGRMPEILEQLLPAVRPGALITDVGSVKAPLVQTLEPLARQAGAVFVGSHPMAGGESTGVRAAKANLFQKALVVLTPTAATPRPALDRVRGLWEAVGARTLEMDAAAHDAHVSRSSHLTHLVAAQLARFVLDPAHGPETAQLCSSGFRDTSRIASGSPEMWRDIALANRDHLDQAIKEFTAGLAAFQCALAAGDGPGIERFFTEGKTRRDAWIHRPSGNA